MNERQNPKEERGPSANQPLVAVPYEYLPLCNPEEDTIDLRELWKVLQRRRRLIFVITAIAIGLAILYVLLAKQVYEAKATIAIGYGLLTKNSGDSVIEYFDTTDVLKHYIDIKYDTSGKYREKGADSFVNSVSIPKKTRGFLTITAMGPDNNRAVKKLNMPIDDIKAKHRAYFDSIVIKKQDKIKEIRHRIDYDINVVLPQLQNSLKLLQTVQLKKIENKIKFLTSDTIHVIEEKISQTEKEIVQRNSAVRDMQQDLKKTAAKDAAMATMTAMLIANLKNEITRLKIRVIDLKAEIRKVQEETIPDLEAQKKHLLDEVIPAKHAEIKKMQDITIPELKTKIKSLESSIKPPYLVMTHIVGDILTHDYPVKPRKKLVIAVAGLAGRGVSI